MNPGDVEPFEIDTFGVMQFTAERPARKSQGAIRAIGGRHPEPIAFQTPDAGHIPQLRARLAQEVNARLATWSDGALLWWEKPYVECGKDAEDKPYFMAWCSFWLLRRPETAALCGNVTRGGIPLLS
jgi:hypothetical protein